MATGAVSEQIQLLFLDAVLHLTARAVELVVEVLGLAFKIRHHIAGIATSVGVLELGDNPPGMIPTVGGIIEIGEPTDFAAQRGKARLSLAQRLLNARVEALIFSHLDAVANRMVPTT